MPPRFLRGVDEVLETLDAIGQDAERGNVEGVACVVVLDGQAWRYSAIPDSDTADLVNAELIELSADVESEGR